MNTKKNSATGRGRKPAAAVRPRKVSPAATVATASSRRRTASVPPAAPVRRARRKAPNSEWWRGGVIYQIYPRSYQDSNGDGIGDLPGITRRLDYVARLGVDAIWLSPFFKSPMKDFGYDVSDYRDVDPMFGTLDDFRALVARAHELGLKVMIDQVLSHTSDQHPWFVESRKNRTNPRADWYVWADARKDGSPPNNWLAIFGGSAWQWDTRRCQYYLHNFLTSQPDLNLHNPKVQDALLADMKFWLELGVDGFRLDTVNFYFHSQGLQDNPARGMHAEDGTSMNPANPYTWQWHRYDKTQPENLRFLQRMRALLDQYPDTTMVGEVGDDDSLKVMADYTADGDKLHMAYCFELLGKDYSSTNLHRVFSRFVRIVGDGWPSWALTNHDCMRLASRWNHKGAPDARLQRLAAVLQMTMRGSPCLYQGDELGLPEAELRLEQLRDPYGITMWPRFKGRDGCRTPFPWQQAKAHAGFSGARETWLPVVDEHRALAVDQQEADPDSLLHFYRRLLAWRRQHPALIKGSIRVLPAHAQCLAFERRLDDARLLCVFNLSGRKATLPLPSAWHQADIDPGCGLRGARLKAGSLHLPPFGGAVLTGPTGKR
ncbi:MAG: alpha-glucosidase family protein [Lautropia sp.]|nr:alpha-glucosidase family protein [Lautropia sp.]